MAKNNRFDGITRLYGNEGMQIISTMHVCIVGLGGVGSWVVEALARSGIGNLTLIDYDEVSEGNINRQMHALDNTIGRKKAEVLRERVLLINPDCQCIVIDDYITTKNLWDYMLPTNSFDYVIDAIDSIKFKSALIYFCKRNKIPIITTGGAGGVTEPASIHVKDLSRTYNDALAANVRSQLRNEYNFPKNVKRYFGVECVFSDQQKLYPDPETGNVSTNKPGIHGTHLDCSYGYGSASYVTASFGFLAASRVINKTLKNRLSD